MIKSVKWVISLSVVPLWVEPGQMPGAHQSFSITSIPSWAKEKD